MSLLLVFLQATPLELSYGDHKKLIEVVEYEGTEYLPLADIAELLDIQFILDHRHQRVTIFDDEHMVRLLLDFSIYESNGKLKKLIIPLTMMDGEIVIGRSQVIPFFADNFGKLIFIKETAGIEISGLRMETKGDSICLEVIAEGEVKMAVGFEGDSGAIEIDGHLASGFELPKPRGIIKEIKISQLPDYIKIRLRMKSPDFSFIHEAKSVTIYPKRRGRVDLIVIDPGHGGIDPGAIGRLGTYEKTINLAIARRLKRIIEKNTKIRVIMTRNSDRYLSLSRRARIANQNKADLFISIHCNASRRRRSEGFEVYFLSEAKTSWERAVAARENASIRFDLPQGKFDSALEYILWDLAQAQFLEESNLLAECIQDVVCREVRINNRGVHQAGFYVLYGCFMPSVLIECAFLSNPKEERRLRSKKFQEELARAIYKGIITYINKKGGS